MAIRSSRRRLLPVLLLMLFAVVFGLLSRDGSKSSPGAGLVAATQEGQAGDSQVTALPIPMPSSVVLESEEEVAKLPRAGEAQGARKAVQSMGPLIIDVRDTNGNPVPDMPLVIHPFSPRKTEKQLRERGADVQITDQAGRAVIPKGRLYRVKDTGLSVYHLVAFEDLPRVRLNKANLAREVIESVLPPFGSVEVQVSEASGDPKRGLPEVMLELVTDEEAMNPSLARKRRSFSSVCEDATAHFPFVELGRTWEAWTYVGNKNLQTRALAAGPVAHRESMQIELHIGQDRPVVKMRLLGTEGAPLAYAGVKVELTKGVFGGSVSTYETDHEGRVWVEVDSEVLRSFPPNLRVIYDPGESAPVLIGKLGPLKDLVKGENDLGDLALEQEIVLVSGTVVDSIGNPVHGARVGFGTRVDYFLGEVPMQHGLANSEKVNTDESGRFEFLGDKLPQGAMVWAYQEADSGRLQSSVVQVTTPGDEFKLVLLRPITFTIELVLPESSNPGELMSRIRLDIKRGEGSKPAPLHSRSTVGEGSTIIYEVTSASGDRYDLRCSLKNPPLEEEFLMEELDIPVGGDDFLVRYDLRDVLYLHRLILEDPLEDSDRKIRGKYRLLKHFEMSVYEDGEDQGSIAVGDEWVTFDFDGNEIEILSTEPTIDVQLLPSEFKEEMLEGLSGEREVLLRSPLRVRLVLVTTGELPSMPYTFNAVLSLDDNFVGEPEGVLWFTDKKRESVFLVPAAGELMVGWQLEKRSGGRAIGSNVLHRQQVRINVLDTPHEQRFELHLDAQALTELTQNPPY